MRLFIVCLLVIIVLLLRGEQQCLAKSARTLYPDDMQRNARTNYEKYEWAKQHIDDQKKDLAWVLEMSDEELWEFIPPADQPRGLNVCFGVGCPVHGDEVFRHGGHYPWIMTRELPFKVKCPVGGEIYPSNDFEAWYKSGKKDKLDSTEKYVDDGYGYVDENGRHYWFVAHYIFWQRWRRDILPVAPKLAEIYFITGDERYAHKAAVMLARIASEYPRMDYNTQAYHNGKYPAAINGKILDYCWEGTGTLAPLAGAYDQLYDFLDKDTSLKSFLADKGITNVREHFEQKFLQVGAKAIIDGKVRGNMNFQKNLAILATVMDNRESSKGLTTDEMVDWIMNGAGEMNTLIYNGVTRDGAASEDSLGYNSIWTTSFYALADKLEPLGYDLWSNPRMKKMTDYFIQTAVAGRFSPTIGDAGKNFLNPCEPIWSTYCMRKAYEHWGDPVYAVILNRIGWPKPDIYEDQSEYEKLKKTGESFGKDLDLKTRDLGGFGLAVLEAGAGDNRRSLSMFYGSAGAGHGHRDRLNIEMIVRGKNVLPDLGYPLHWGAKSSYWTQSTVSHYCVEIDQQWQAKKEGHLNLLVDSPEVRMVDASAESVYPGAASLYRRTVAMVDVSPEDSYLVDIFRVKGGKRHDYLFHGLPHGKFSLTGVALGEPAKGTLLGEDVEYGEADEKTRSSGYQFLRNPRRGKPEGTWSADWSLKDTGLKMTMLKGSAQELIVADAEPDAKEGYPEKMEWLIARNDDRPSAYISIIEPYAKKPFIRRAVEIKPDGGDGEGLTAVRVDSKGRSDYLIHAVDGSKPASFDDEKLEFQGEFGAVSVDESGMRSMVLANGSRLTKDDWSISAEPLSAKITSVDYRKNTVTLDRRLPVPNAVIGQTVVISNDHHSASYTVQAVDTKDGKVVLHFGDVSLIEGMLTLKSVDDEKKYIETPDRLSGYGCKWQGKLFPGRTVVNKSLTDSWLITSYGEFGDGRFTIQSKEPVSDKFAGPDGKPDDVFYLAEACAGDEVMVPSIVSIHRGENNTYTIQAAVPFKLMMPLGGVEEPSVEHLQGKQWKQIKAKVEGKSLSLDISPTMLKSGRLTIRSQVK